MQIVLLLPAKDFVVLFVDPVVFADRIYFDTVFCLETDFVEILVSQAEFVPCGNFEPRQRRA